MNALTTSPIGVELLDHPDADPAQVRASLLNISRANRYFGGTAAVRWGVRRLMAGRPDTNVALLDVGAGAGDVIASVAAMLSEQGHAVRSTALERHRAAAGLLRANGWPTVLADVAAMPFPDQAFDIVILSQLLHHFAEDSAIAVLRHTMRVARIGVVVADLRRSWWARAAFRAGSRALGFDDATREDGLTSIRRAYHPAELLRLVRQASPRATVARRPGWRVVATLPAA